MSDDITIRPAVAEDGMLAADLIFSTGPELFDYLFYRNRQKNLDLIRRLFCADGNSLSHNFAHIAELNGRPAGLLHAVDPREKMLSSESMAGNLVNQIGWTAFLIRTPRLLKIGRLVPATGKNTYYIQHLATRKASSGRGVGRRMLTFCQQRAVHKGLGSLTLDVEAGNSNAIELYRSFGFTIAAKTDDRTFRRKYGFRGLYRMVKFTGG